MSSYSNAGGPAEAFGAARWQGKCGLARWKPLEIAAIVAGFVIWWPVGLALLGLKVAQRRGYSLDDAMASMRSTFGRSPSGPAAQTRWRPFGAAPTGNAAFDEWRAAELAKLDEERRKLDAAEREFSEHLDNLRRARDREEFEAFMRARNPDRSPGELNLNDAAALPRAPRGPLRRRQAAPCNLMRWRGVTFIMLWSRQASRHSA